MICIRNGHQSMLASHRVTCCLLCCFHFLLIIFPNISLLSTNDFTQMIFKFIVSLKFLSYQLYYNYYLIPNPLPLLHTLYLKIGVIPGKNRCKIEPTTIVFTVERTSVSLNHSGLHEYQ